MFELLLVLRILFWQDGYRNLDGTRIIVQSSTAYSRIGYQFWAGLADGKHGFTAAEVALVRQTLSIGAFVKNTLPLVTALNQRFAAGT